MHIGIPTESKIAERRVGATPAVVGELTANGHEVMVQTRAGDGAGFDDVAYKEAGAAIAGSASEVFGASEMIVKVKEPQASERAMLRPHHTLFTYLHLAADRPQTDELIASGATCIAYETVTDDDGRLPLLAPLSALAGRMSIQAGAHALESPQGGAGLLMGGVPGVKGARAPHLVARQMLSVRRPGAVIVDVAVDQGGCVETTRPTTHLEPTYVIDGIVHYCVANMPGGVPRTSTLALSNATLPYALALAGMGTDAALRTDAHLRNGRNICSGMVTDRAVADTFGLDYVDPLEALDRR